MLKIYLKAIRHVIRSNDMEYKVHQTSFYTIEDEEAAKSYTREYNLYSDEIQNVAYYCSTYNNKRGRAVYVCGDDCFLRFKQWKEPNAKLVEGVVYKEHACSMNTLFRLPADKVIAYLKQEGMNLATPS